MTSPSFFGYQNWCFFSQLLSHGIEEHLSRQAKDERSEFEYMKGMLGLTGRRSLITIISSAIGCNVPNHQFSSELWKNVTCSWLSSHILCFVALLCKKSMCWFCLGWKILQKFLGVFDDVMTPIFAQTLQNSFISSYFNTRVSFHLSSFKRPSPPSPNDTQPYVKTLIRRPLRTLRKVKNIYRIGPDNRLEYQTAPCWIHPVAQKNRPTKLLWKRLANLETTISDFIDTRAIICINHQQRRNLDYHVLEPTDDPNFQLELFRKTWCS